MQGAEQELKVAVTYQRKTGRRKCICFLLLAILALILILIYRPRSRSLDTPLTMNPKESTTPAVNRPMVPGSEAIEDAETDTVAVSASFYTSSFSSSSLPAPSPIMGEPVQGRPPLIRPPSRPELPRPGIHRPGPFAEETVEQGSRFGWERR